MISIWLMFLTLAATEINSVKQKCSKSNRLEAKLKFIAKPSEAVAKSGSSIEMYCEVFSVGKPRLYWTRSSRIVKRNEIGRMDTIQQLAKTNEAMDNSTLLNHYVVASKLIFPCVNETSTGLYACVVENTCNKIQSLATLKSEGQLGESGECDKRSVKPVITDWIETRLEQPKVAVQLTCRAYSKRKARIHWHIYDEQSASRKPLPPDTLQLDNGDLLIRAGSRGEKGALIYQCVASNANGNDTVYTLLYTATKYD